MHTSCHREVQRDE